MQRKKINRKKIIEKKEREEVIKFAKSASFDAQRSSKALNISYQIIKDGSIYEVNVKNVVKIKDLQKIKAQKNNLKKGSVICLKRKD
ncbi:hypothetical protein [Bergeyella zoohelcum]|uniref:Uncharacterized protein n=1 Tax=Bergeyella zoohelcum ATCC 43767 TaxID=883096 RepID=K1LJ02_9FLAO|nr:hypothetical protein [Bergeyella zoohelcum]EKB56700.1 hypothetical protein HMPREF9699_01429 [Bergeyella zoohelcum ATCC 43767]SUV48392.1 Uncharacterised protein [Bergeyella zoohelcum]